MLVRQLFCGLLLFAVASPATAQLDGFREPIPTHQRGALPDATTGAVTGLNSFGYDLFSQLKASDNALISPLSITTAFGMAYAGAAGGTAHEMERVFGFSSDTHVGLGSLIADLNTERDGREMRIANRVFAQEGLHLKPGFEAINRDSYESPIERLNFYVDTEASREHINDWVEEQTNDRIKDLLPGGSVTQDTRVVLTNAVYLNSLWKHEFLEQSTRDRDFTLGDGSVATASMMHQTDTFRYGEFDGYQMLEMPYAGDDLSMVVILPDEADGLKELVDAYDEERLESDFDSLSHEQVRVAFPKFEYEATMSLKNPLVEMGLTESFSNGADFSNLADGSFAISDVLHKTFIDVSESGTEAAAATAIAIGLTSVLPDPPEPKEFTADQSFLFAIRDNHSDALMFLGQLTDPSSDKVVMSYETTSTVPEPSAWLMAMAALACCTGSRRSS
ncbi:Serpin (serine protease inhibitor) [Pseudobythopirellula maris]|uniref:Serpin (Serine protease inhibitor) n=1 Tax=Pseudobythopirellula maris TaxID=2527991 RepID=A0A5C5ZRG0_9BACT|nr:serpin family protein [Pseudobythopirellula maris]TWT90099.1 Serpin (serine protease inhibitor) [Pseudobythopirellula maris]